MKINKSNTKSIIYIGLLIGLTLSNAIAKESNMTASASIVGMSMDYKEYDTSGTLLDSEESSYSDITGTDMSLGYIYDKDNSSFSHIKLNLLVLSGETEYTGAYLSGGSYGSVVSTTQNSIIDTDMSFTHTKLYKNNFEFSYGIGLGSVNGRENYQLHR